MRVTALTDVGLVRNTNEDVYWFDSDRGILILADGLGGHRAGEVAAALAVKIAADRLSLAIDQGSTDLELIDAMYETFRVASEEVFIRGNEKEETQGMACSLIAAVVGSEECLVGHAGDSRMYLYFQDNLSLMTTDDTPVAALVKRGYLLPEKAKSHRMKNVLVKSVGSRPDLEANISRFPVNPGERLVLCTDGLWSLVDQPTMTALLREYSGLQEVCGQLIAAARANGGTDNITVILAELPKDRHTTVEMPRMDIEDAGPEAG